MEIKFTSKFAKLYNKAPRKIKNSFDFRLGIFIKNKYEKILNNHHLSGRYEGFRSINVTGDWRAVFREFNNGEVIYFDLLGTHSKLYEK